MRTFNLIKLLPCFILLLITSCKQKQEQSQMEEDQRVRVQVDTLVSAPVDQIGIFTATVEAEVTNNIAPQMAVRIVKTFVEVGDHVVKGQKLAEMDLVNLNQTKLQMENDKMQFERTDRLYKSGGVSKAEWEARKLAYELSTASYQNLLENTYLTSPISGIVTKRNYDSGDMYGMGMPLYVVEQIRPVKLVVHVSEALFTRIKKGMEVDVSFDTYEDEVFKGSVVLIHPSIDPATRTFPVEVKIPNNNEKIIPGMFARVTFNYGSRQRVLIPDKAIQKQSGSADNFVYVIKNSKAEYRKITYGRRIGDEFEVLDGLAEGEVVVLTGQSRLDNGVSVEIIN